MGDYRLLKYSASWNYSKMQTIADVRRSVDGDNHVFNGVHPGTTT
jgi:hypothetical protein